MNLEQQCLSLNLAKRLKELNIKQESLFYWEWVNDNCYGITYFPYCVTPRNTGEFLHFSAFTASELLEMLPDYLDDAGCLKIEKHDVSNEGINYFVEYGYGYYQQQEQNLSNALAKMLIHLHEQGLIQNDRK